MENEKLYKTLKTMPNIFEKKINELLVSLNMKLSL